MRRLVGILLALALVLPLGGTSSARAATSEFRAFWVDAFGDGIYDEDQVDKLVAAAKAANVNALVVQIGRRGDCFCGRASMPRTQAAIAPYPYDPLDTVIAKAHAAGIQVHAWIITTAMWNSSVPPRDPRHVFNLHGPMTTGYDNWLGVRYDGALREGTSPSANWFFDPGHPAAAAYIAEMFLSVARNYDIDGLNFDRVRYPDLQVQPWPNDGAWGYNAVALGRFQAATGRGDLPLPNDPAWQQWRRDQVTNIVRKVYVEAHALKPRLRISADTITYGAGPQELGGWEQSRPYRETLQDWRAWLEEGILDTNIPMNYKREHRDDQRRWYEEWNEFAKDHQYGRSTTVGSALYLNTIANSVIQVRKALAPSASGRTGIGWVGYSYRTPDDQANAGLRTSDASRAELTRALTQASEYDAQLPPVFAEPAAVPGTPWTSAPTRGHVAGTVATDTGVPFDQIRVELRDPETDAVLASHLTDGSGYFAFVDVLPGRYKVFVPDDPRATGKRVALTDVTAGAVSRVRITPFASGAEGHRPPHAAIPTYVPAEDPAAPAWEPNGSR